MDCDSAHAWPGVEAFKNYVTTGGYHIDGLYGTSTSGFSSAQVGDIIQVDMERDGTYDHSYVVTAVTGTLGQRTADQITVCSHTVDLHNAPFNSVYNSSKNYRTIHINIFWFYSDDWLK